MGWNALYDQSQSKTMVRCLPYFGWHCSRGLETQHKKRILFRVFFSPASVPVILCTLHFNILVVLHVLISILIFCQYFNFPVTCHWVLWRELYNWNVLLFLFLLLLNLLLLFLLNNKNKRNNNTHVMLLGLTSARYQDDSLINLTVSCE